MPEIVACPECRRTLRVPDDLLGKMVRCPACKATFTAAVEEAAPSHEGHAPKNGSKNPEDEHAPRMGALRGDEEFEERPLRRRRDDYDDEPPPDDYDDDDELEEATARRRHRSRRGSRAEWQRAKQGLGYLLAAVCTLVGAFIVVLCGSFVFGIAAAAAAGRNAKPPDVAVAGGGILAIVGVFLAALLAVLVLQLVGLILCAYSPEYRAARTLAQVALGSFVVYLVVQLLQWVLIIATLGLAAVNPMEMATAGHQGVVLILAVIGSLAWLTHGSALIFYFRNLALALRENGLATNAVCFFIFYVLFGLMSLILIFAGAARGADDMMVNREAGAIPPPNMGLVAFSCLFGLMGLALLIWYIVTLAVTRRAIAYAKGY